MFLASSLLVFFARVACSQNIETYRYDVADVTRDIATTTLTTNYTIDGTRDKLNASDYDERVKEDFIETPSEHVELSSKMQKVSSPREKNYIPICCKPGLYLINSKCTSNDALPVAKLEFPPMYNSSLSVSELRAEELIPKYGIPCAEWDDMHPLQSPPIGEDVFYLLENGTIYHDFTNSRHDNLWYDETAYCWANVMDGNESVTLAAVCFGFPEEDEKEEGTLGKSKTIGMILSLPFLLATFIIYSVLPELKTMHGSTLRSYIACLFVAYSALSTVQFGNYRISSNDHLCLSLAFVIQFSFLASFFWLNVMCFDIWWTFGGFRSLQGSVRQREQKKFIIYSAYAWGSAWILTGICLIMELVPSIPTTWIRPEFGLSKCWFHSNGAVALYFYGPMGLTVICNICLFISTALKIIQHKKDTAHHLKGMDSRRHDDNKQWFNLYLKLFIVMGINWSMEIVSWCFKDKSPHFIWYLTDLANTLQGVIIFVIFVCKSKIKRLLLKRLGFRDRNLQSGNSTRSAYHSSASRTCTSTRTAAAPLQEKSNPYAERTIVTTDESDCV